MNRILTWRDSPLARTAHGDFIPFENYIQEQMGQRGRGMPPTPTGAVGEVLAYINHSRLLADCPVSWCGGATFVDPGFRYFMCPECANEANAGQWFAVVLPEDMREIEGILLEREDPTTRNWRTPETCEDLRTENAVLLPSSEG